MKKVLFFALVILSTRSHAQYDSPSSYMSYFGNMEQTLGEDYMSYMSAVAHSRARKMERKRQEVLSTIKETVQKTRQDKGYKGDLSLKQAFLDYFIILQSVLNEDYAKIVDMEEIAEQSYDGMEAYLLAQEKASERLNQAGEKRHKSYHEFADKNNVKIIESTSKTSDKLEQTARVMNYYHQVYLIFFKSNKQDGYVWKAVNDNDINGIEQNRGTLSKYSSEGISKLAGIKAYENDNTIIVACRKALEFYKTEADKKVPAITDYLIRKQDFDKVQKSIEAKPAARRTSLEVADYNKKVNEINEAVQNYNKTNKEISIQQSKVIDDWNRSVKSFIDNHVPKSR